MERGMLLPPFSAMGVLHAAVFWHAHRVRRVTPGRSYQRHCGWDRAHCVVWKKGRPLTASRLAPVAAMIAEACRFCVHEAPSCARRRRLINRETTPQVHTHLSGRCVDYALQQARDVSRTLPWAHQLDERTKVGILGRRAPSYAPWLALDTISAAAVHRGRRQRMSPTWLGDRGQGQFHH